MPSAAAGAVQLTDRLVADSRLTVTPVGASGGGSSTSVTLIVTSWDASTVVSALPSAALPSCTLTVTEYDASASWSSVAPDFTVIRPAASMSNGSWSVPLPLPST